MTPTDLLRDAFGRVHESVQAVLDGLDAEQLRHRPGPDANPIGWLVWHLARVQDDHVADVAGHDQVYVDFVDRFDLPYDATAIGYGHSSAEVGAFAAPADLLADYEAAVHERTRGYLATVSDDDLDKVVDVHRDPPVTLGVRLVSVVNDDTQHVGQAAYVRGLLGL
ncbi:MAG: chorismate synthase [Nocardioides sp.]|jgi:uncharacterized damage-inducible protein DinB|nr:chorismate synthase [Nocardioides sp.]